MAIVSKYSFNGNTNDSTGTNNGTPTALSYTSGKNGEAGSFNGTTTYVAISDSPTLTPTNMSISCIVKTTQTGTVSIATKRNNSGYVGYLFTINSGSSGTIQMDIYDTTDRFSRSVDVGVNNGKWNYIEATCNSAGSILLYINGLEVSGYSVKQTTGFTNSDTNGLLHLGSYAPSIGGLLQGGLDELIIYNHIRSPAEIKNTYLFYNGFI